MPKQKCCILQLMYHQLLFTKKHANLRRRNENQKIKIDLLHDYACVWAHHGSSSQAYNFYMYIFTNL